MTWKVNPWRDESLGNPRERIRRIVTSVQLDRRDRCEISDDRQGYSEDYLEWNRCLSERRVMSHDDEMRRFEEWWYQMDQSREPLGEEKWNESRRWKATRAKNWVEMRWESRSYRNWNLHELNHIDEEKVHPAPMIDVHNRCDNHSRQESSHSAPNISHRQNHFQYRSEH